MFQKCPCCGGTGKESPQYTNALPITCTVCNGYKIISELTGLPPSYTTNKAIRDLEEKELSKNNFGKYPLKPEDCYEINDNNEK